MLKQNDINSIALFIGLMIGLSLPLLFVDGNKNKQKYTKKDVGVLYENTN